MDNTPTERAIRPFTIGGRIGYASTLFIVPRQILYSIVETAKANGLKVYNYLEYLLTELTAHAKDTTRDFLKDLLPRSKAVQEKCSDRKKS